MENLTLVLGIINPNLMNLPDCSYVLSEMFFQMSYDASFIFKVLVYHFV